MTEKLFFTRAGKSHNLSMGIVGLPNVGKSTLFNALCKQSVPAENYPFCTINPSDGILQIKDPRVTNLQTLYKPKSLVNAVLHVTDIAGLIKGASEGLGLGNNFLEHIRRVDGIFHVVRCFEEANVVHTEDSLDPIRDIKIVNDELRLKDYDLIKRRMEKGKKELRNADKKILAEMACMEKLCKILESQWASQGEYTNDEIKFINTLNLLTTKSVVYLANISEGDYKNRRANKHLKSMAGIGTVIPFSAEFESNLNVDNPDGDEQSVFVGKLLQAGYKSLNLINFFTAGSDEVRAWTVRRGSKAPQAGGVIHTDFEQYFVMAEVMAYEDLDMHKTELEVKKAGKYNQRGKLYVVEDGDIIYFKSNPPKSAGKKK